MNVSLQASLDDLNAKLPIYSELARKTPAEALARVGADIGYRIGGEVAKFTPGKGQITAERLAALKAGGGIHIRPEIREKVYGKLGAFSSLTDRAKYLNSGKSGRKNFLRFGKAGRKSTVRGGKRLGLQAIVVKAELAAREKGRNYVPAVARLGGKANFYAALQNSKSLLHRGRYNQLLASAGISASWDSTSLVILYGSSKTEGGTALAKPRQEAIVKRAVEGAADNVAEYISDKLEKAGKR